MGISSNQARLMTLCSRQHDLELRAQNISAQKMIKAMQSQEMATKYSDALNDYSMMKSGELTKTSGKSGSSSSSTSSFGTNVSGVRRVAAAAPRLCVNATQVKAEQTPTTLTLKSDLRADTFVSGNAKESTVFIDLSSDSTFKADNVLSTTIRDAVVTDTAVSVSVAADFDDGEVTACREFIFDMDDDFGLDDDTPSSGSSNVSDQDSSTYTKEECEDFLRKAQNDYDTETAKLSAEEKRLDMELTQINTEHSAVTTEYDSVKSLISDNTDKSFNIFS